MDAETRAHLFEPFYTTKGLASGSGLGLATIYGIVKQNDGAITVDSAPGQGTRISVYLKRYGSSPSFVQPSGLAKPGRATILVVEEEPAVLRLVTRALTERGYGVLVASSPQQAQEVVAQHQGGIDALLSAVVMPEASGEELARRIRRHHPSIRVLYMTSYPADALDERYRVHDHAPMLQKPFTIAELVRQIESLLETPSTERPT